MMRAFPNHKHLFREARMMRMSPAGAPGGAPGETPEAQKAKETATRLEKINGIKDDKDAAALVIALRNDAVEIQKDALAKVDPIIQKYAETDFNLEKQKTPDLAKAAENVSKRLEPAGYAVKLEGDKVVVQELSASAEKSPDAPRTIGEKLEQTMEKAIKDASEAMAKGDIFKAFLCAVKGLAALMQYFKLATNGTLDDPIKGTVAAVEKNKSGSEAEKEKEKAASRGNLKQKLKKYATDNPGKGAGDFKENLKTELGKDGPPATGAKADLEKANKALPEKEKEVEAQDKIVKELEAKKLKLSGDAANTVQKDIEREEAKLKIMKTAVETAKKDKEDLAKKVAQLQSDIPELQSMIDGLDSQASKVKRGLKMAAGMVELLPPQMAKDLAEQLKQMELKGDPVTLEIKISKPAPVAPMVADVMKKISTLLNRGLSGPSVTHEELGVSPDGVIDADRLQSFLQEKVMSKLSGVTDKLGAERLADTVKKLAAKQNLDGTKNDLSDAERTAITAAAAKSQQWNKAGDHEYFVTKDRTILRQKTDGTNVETYDATKGKFTAYDAAVSHYYDARTDSYERVPLKEGSTAPDTGNRTYDLENRVWKMKGT